MFLVETNALTSIGLLRLNCGRAWTLCSCVGSGASVFTARWTDESWESIKRKKKKTRNDKTKLKRAKNKQQNNI
jgi:hypothetical protein